MKKPWPLLVLILAQLIAVPLEAQEARPATEGRDGPPTADLSFGPRFFIGGLGGVYFFVQPGELVIEVMKRDRHLFDRKTELRAILAGPDRRVLQEASLLDDGQPRGSGLGPIQHCRLSTRVARTGVYVLNITASQDRYGEEVIWAFRSNCRKFLIETARGHKDEAHQEPIVLASPNQTGDVCFLPRRDAFTLEVSDLLRESRPPQLFNSTGKLVATLEPDANGRASRTLTLQPEPEPKPWRLHLPSAQAAVSMDGVTRWSGDDAPRDMAYWTPDLDSWFPLFENRWLLTPYSRAIYSPPDMPAEAALQLRNDAPHERTFQLAVEFPDRAWPAALSMNRVVLGAKEATSVTLRCAAPNAGHQRECYLRATPLDGTGFTTYATVVVKGGEAPASKPLDLPLLLRPYQHENEQLGYLPDYPVENQVYFDQQNQPFVLAGQGVARCSGGQWTTPPLDSIVHSSAPAFKTDAISFLSTKIAFDRDNDVYLLARAGPTSALLHSTNRGRTFEAHAIPGREDRPRSYDLEQFSGHNGSDGPPCVVRFTHTASDERLIWRRLHDLDLFVPKKVNGKIVLGSPVRISDRSIGLSAHSGIPSSVVSRAGKVHVAWGEATDPEAKVPGLPAFVVTYDRETGRLGQPALVGHGAPANDIHNTPSITVDSQGYLHVVSGTHGTTFPYARSLQPNDAGAGWTPPEFVGRGLRQTYVGFVCGPDDTLHLAFRLWRAGEPFPASLHATLAWQRKRPGQPWEEPRVLVVAPFSEYSVYYHRLTIDRAGRLFLSYDYWSTYWFYRNDHFGRRRALLLSADGGDRWKLAENPDLISLP